MTTYIRDIFDLPDRVRRGDFVLRLNEGVTRPQETVESYVVTPQLVGAFDEALGLIGAALQAHSSKAAYLHGSFGSGKSHFMAVLHLILRNEPHARSIPELAPVIARHNNWTEGKKFLLVPYHMIGARDMESAILGGYAEHVRRLHPDAPVPGVYRADEMFADAGNLRRTMGDDAFFTRLNEGRAGSGTSSGWGNIGAGWEAESFERTLAAEPKSEDRIRLVGDLIATYFSAVRGAGEFVDLDSGLSIVSRHARSLGYDALILFLDELILWLASHAADASFISREGQKLAKLVEAQSADRPAPIVSFVARQRDLKELIGDNVVGAELVSFGDVLKWWEARFSKITLEDRNLPAIAAKRVLRPKSEAARQQLDAAFRGTESIREEVMNTLLTSHADRGMFRQVYPFSPALVETLVAVSFFLQRERTALKVMQQLLVEQKDRLKLGEIIPVGDLFDVVAEGDEAFSDIMKAHFDNAKKLYEGKLKPILEREHGLTFEQMKALPPEDAKATKLRNDDRLVKTLLLAGLAPNVESLRALTAGKLAALNHGTIKSPIAGREYSTVAAKFRTWAGEVGQIKVGEGTNPTISVQLTGVDTDSIIEQARTEDNHGNRVRKAKELLFRELGVELEDVLIPSHDFVWRATKRSCRILFANVRELPDASLASDEEEWRVIIDFPFDPQDGHSPKDDISRLETFRVANEKPSQVIAWIPSFLSRQAQSDLGTLVCLDFILKEERFPNYVAHLSPIDRNAARSLLDNQRSQLRQRLINYIEGAYGIATPAPGSIDPTYDLTPAEHFQTLDPGFTLQPPVGATLQQAFEHLLDQTMRHQYPAHPAFEAETKLNTPALRRVYETFERALQTDEPVKRLQIETGQRKELRLIANPLKLGEMHETHFVVHNHWEKHFLKKASEQGGSLTVAGMRAWIDQPQAMGLPRDVQNLVILCFAAQTNRSFYRHASPVAAAVDNLPDDCELHEQKLPTRQDWETATERAAQIFGISRTQLVNAANVARLIAEVKTLATVSEAASRNLVKTLGGIVTKLAASGQSCPRFRSAQGAQALIGVLKAAPENRVIEELVHAEIQTTATALGASLRKAEEVVNELGRFNWELIEAVERLNDERKDAARIITEALREAFEKDEYAIALAPALREAETKAVRLLSAVPQTIPSSPPTTPTMPTTPTATMAAPAETSVPVPPPPGYKVLAQETRDAVTADQLEAIAAEMRASLKKRPKARLKIHWEVYEK